MRLPDAYCILLREDYGVFYRSGFCRVSLDKTSPKKPQHPAVDRFLPGLRPVTHDRHFQGHSIQIEFVENAVPEEL